MNMKLTRYVVYKCMVAFYLGLAQEGVLEFRDACKIIQSVLQKECHRHGFTSHC